MSGVSVVFYGIFTVSSIVFRVMCAWVRVLGPGQRVTRLCLLGHTFTCPSALCRFELIAWHTAQIFWDASSSAATAPRQACSLADG